VNGDTFLKHMQPIVDMAAAAKQPSGALTPYTAVVAEGSMCPDCRGTPVLLMPVEFHPFLPAFYICECGRIGQVGVGEVRVSQKCGED
jgi:hypothetical protein